MYKKQIQTTRAKEIERGIKRETRRTTEIKDQELKCGEKEAHKKEREEKSPN